MPERSSPDSELLAKLKKTSKDVIDYFTTLGTLNLSSLSQEAEDTRLKLRQELINILSDELNNVDEPDDGVVPPDDIGGAEDYEVPTATLPRNAKPKEPDTESASSEKKETKAKSDDAKTKKKTLGRTKSIQIVSLPKTEDVKKQGNLSEKKMMRSKQYWAVLGADMLYLAKSSSETTSEAKVRLNDASVAVQKNTREFSIKRQGKTLTLRAESDEDCVAWVDSIRQCIVESSGVDGQFSDDEEDNGDVISDVISQGPDDVYENEDDVKTEQPAENGGIDEPVDDEIYDDVEAPAEPQETSKRPGSVSSTKSNNAPTMSNKRTSGFLGSIKGKDMMPFPEGKLAAYIQKKGTWSWDKKWFILSEQTLYYSNSESDKKCQGTLSLNGASVDTKASAHSGESRTFSVTIKHKSTKMQLAWDDSLVYDEWLKALKAATGDDQASEPTPSETELKEEDERIEDQEEYVNPEAMTPTITEPIMDDVYDDVVAQPEPSSNTPPEVPKQSAAARKSSAKPSTKAEIENAEYSGFLYRKGTGLIKKWDHKWFFIYQKMLYIASNEGDENFRNFVQLDNVSEVEKVASDKQYPHGITLRLKPNCGKDVILAGESKEDQASWVLAFESACEIFNCELSSEGEEGDGGLVAKPSATSVTPQVDEPAVDEAGFIMEDIYEDVSQPLDLPPPRTVVPKTVTPKEAPKPDTLAPSLPPRNPSQKATNQPELPPNLPRRPASAKSPGPTATVTEPEPIMEEFYEDMDEVKAEYENAKLLASTEQQSSPKTELPVPKPENVTPKKSPLLKKKEIKKEKEAKKESKKKEKDSKKKKEKEKSKTLTKSKPKASEETTIPPRSNTFTPGTVTQEAQNDEEYVVQELSAQDEEGYIVEEKQTEPEPIDDEIYEDVIEPPPPTGPKNPPADQKPPVQKSTSPPVEKPSSPPVQKPTSPPATESKVATSRASFTSPSGDSKRATSPSGVTSPIRSSSGSVKINISSTKSDTKTEPKTPTTTTSTESTTSSAAKPKPVTTTGSLNRQRPGVMKVSDRMAMFQKRESVSDSILYQGSLYHKAPGRTRFRQEYCKISGTVLSFYREKGDEKSFGSLNLEECEMCIVKEQYEGRRYVFSLAAGSAIDLLSAEFQGDLNKWLGFLEPLVKKYVKEG